MGEDGTACPAVGGAQVNPTVGHRDKGNFGDPDMVCELNLETAQEIWTNVIERVLLTGVGLVVQRSDAQSGHQGCDVPQVDIDVF